MRTKLRADLWLCVLIQNKKKKKKKVTSEEVKWMMVMELSVFEPSVAL